MLLAEPDGLRSDLDVLILFYIIERVFERHLPDRSKSYRLIGSGSADIRQLFVLGRIHRKIPSFQVFPDDHAFIDIGSRLDEDRSSFLKVPEAVGHRCSRESRYHRSDIPLLDRSFILFKMRE